jgi:primosomal protein N'
MSIATFFAQECPTCGRTLQIRIEYLGKSLVCQHCRGRFDAQDPSCGTPKLSDSGILMERVEELLASTKPLQDAR